MRTVFLFGWVYSKLIVLRVMKKSNIISQQSEIQEREGAAMGNIHTLISDSEAEMLRHFPLPLCVLTLEEDSGNARLLIASDAACEFFGRDREHLSDIMNGGADDYVHPNDRQIIHILLNELKQGGVRHTARIFRISKQASGHYESVTMNASARSGEDGAFAAFLVFSETPVDFQDKEESLQKMNNSVLLLDKILSTTQAAIFWKDADRRFRGANQAFLDYYGFQSQQEILGKTDEDMGWHTEPQAFMDDEMQILKEGKSTYRVHGKCLCRGEQRDIRASKAPLYTDGKIVGLVGSFEDVTKDIQLEKAIFDLNQKLEDSLQNEQKAMAIRTDFFTRVSHDLRTPLTTVLGLSELALQETQTPSNQDYFQQIHDASEYMLSIITDILDMQKIETGQMTRKPVVFNIESLDQKVVSIIRPAAERKHQEFRFDRNPLDENLLLYSDSRLIEQILVNLLNNAVKYTPEGGSILLKETAERQEDGSIRLQFTVKDSGIGMSADFQKHMYEPFKREENPAAQNEMGTGLGLSIVRHNVDFLGGTLGCSSEQGKGTEFTVTLPIAEAPADKLKEYRVRQASVIYTGLKGRKVLICEDVAANAKIIARLLARQEVESEIAPDGQAGLNLARINRYDAILMDTHMPIMDGLEATRAIRAFDETTPILGLSADTYPESVEKCLQAGMNGHIGKPINVEELYRSLNRCIIAAGS
jgi:PAS domain S-box-containing protein